MKCDELKAYVCVCDGWCCEKEAYPKDKVDEAIAELKKKLAEKSEKILELQKASDVALSKVYTLLDEIESLKASHYAESVDAGMRERRLKRALWLKRADDAKHLVVAYENYDYLDCQEMTIKQENARTWMTCKLRTAEEWVKVWKNVERKCIKKAEEYK